MMIRHKGLEHNIYGEAPFVGARLCAITCSRGCPGCQNRHLLNEPYQETDAADLIEAVVLDPFDEGIIFGGLEWTEQPDELNYLVELAKRSGLQVMVYTGLTEEEYKSRFTHKNIWVKFGEYSEKHKAPAYYSCGILLPTTNQHVKFLE